MICIKPPTYTSCCTFGQMKPNLLLLHGALGTKHQFDVLIPYLQKEFTIHTLNFSGHGNVPQTSKFTIELFTEEIYSFLEKNKLTECHLFGFSMGGYVALNFAAKYPKKNDQHPYLWNQVHMELKYCRKRSFTIEP